MKVDRVTSAKFRSAGLSPASFDVLAHVASSEGQTQQELADSLLVTKGNICQLLDRMERGGLIERRQEGRSNRLFLTFKGRELVRWVTPAHEQVLEECFSTLEPAEQATMLKLLRRVDRSVDHMMREDDPCGQS